MGAEEGPPDGNGLTFAVDASLPMELGLEAGILELERHLPFYLYPSE